MKCQLFSRKLIQYLGGNIRNITILLLLSLSFGTVTDIDGNVYETVQIGEQSWMAENLKVTHYNDGSEIPTGHSNSDWTQLYTGAYTVYDNDPVNAEIYGNLYNQYAVMRGDLCMGGWHIPTDDEWTILERYICNVINGNSDCESTFPFDDDSWSWRGTNEGASLKETGNEHWNIPNYADNLTGFTALPAGERMGSGALAGTYHELGNRAYFWTSTYLTGNIAWARHLTSDSTNIFEDYNHINRGMSVRCVEDDIAGCTNPEACNYDETATNDNGSCEYEYDCTGTCGGDLEPDCCGVCGGDNSQCSNCCGSPFYEDCSDDCAIDLNGVCCYELEVDTCGECNGDGTDCNDDGIPDDCEEVYSEGYETGLGECLYEDTDDDGYDDFSYEAGADSGDVNGDGTNDILDIVTMLNNILYNNNIELCNEICDGDWTGNFDDDGNCLCD